MVRIVGMFIVIITAIRRKKLIANRVFTILYLHLKTNVTTVNKNVRTKKILILTPFSANDVVLLIVFNMV
ncbi:hypothetical protein J2Z82_003867 [Virgibacillus litoralis]|uniref:Secreted protein n=1 Tax=Virgibacillus litoralis TaxID=578221 RepID=A0ABS4HIZ5_9BACI|nr:hypothetical protein [Virgibacillus litoralis]